MRIAWQLLAGGGISVVNITIHALVMTLVVRTAQNIAVRTRVTGSFFLPGMMIGVVSILMAAHAVEVLVWALGYAVLGVAPAGVDTVYFAFVNYTTLGYGDVIPVKSWQLLGPATALNGVLMIGWSTAVIFEVLRRSLELDPSHARPIL
jgi:hypothetical protein